MIFMYRLLLIWLLFSPYVAAANWLQFASSQKYVTFKDTKTISSYPCAAGGINPELDTLAMDMFGKCTKVWVLINYPKAGWFDPKSRKMLLEFQCRNQTYSILFSETYKKENAEGAGTRENGGTDHVPPESNSPLRVLYTSVC